MKLRNSFSGPITLKQPWVIVGLGCPSLFLVFKWIDFSDWWNIFHLLGLVALVIAIPILLMKKFVGEKYKDGADWFGSLFLDWYFMVFIISQITRDR